MRSSVSHGAKLGKVRATPACVSLAVRQGSSQSRTPRSGVADVRGHGDFIDAEPVAQQTVDSLLPVVEITGNDQRRLGGHFALHEVGQKGGLAQAAALDQAEMHADQVHLAALAAAEARHRVQQAALFQHMVGDVVVGEVDDAVAREDRVAVVAMRINGVHAVGAVRVGAGGEKVELRTGHRVAGLRASRSLRSCTSCRKTMSASIASSAMRTS
jgi:hypothetical protein